MAGIMTEEVGAVTGDLEVTTRLQQSVIEVAVRYAGADEWYTVKGSPIESSIISGSPSGELHELNQRVAKHLTTPGLVVEGNEEPTSLQGFSPAPSEG